MPIRINLLAEAQAAEELRRKDPVKRAALAAGCVVCCVLLWASTLQFKIIAAKSDLHTLETKWKSIEKSYQVAVESRRKALEAEEKLGALQHYTANRFLWGSALNAFQQTLNGVDDVQVTRLRTEQSYFLTEETKPRTNGTMIIAGKPATSTEKILLTVEAVDSSPQPGTHVNKFKEAIVNVPYFQSNLQKTNGVLLTSLSAPQTGPLGRTPYVLFTLQCFFPEKVC
jgi:hypothetical protein